MNVYKNILFYADGAPGERVALARAITLAEHSGSRLTVMDTVGEIGTNETTPSVLKAIKSIQKTLIRERQAVLDELIVEVMAGRTKPKTKSLVVPGKDTLEVVKVVNEKNFDLVVKSVEKKRTFSALFGTHDLRLMRKSPCPVWIIKPSRRKRLRNIVASVDPSHESKEGVALNLSILNAASLIAQMEGAQLHVLNVWKFPLGPSMERKMLEGEFEKVFNNFKAETERQIEHLMDRFTADSKTYTRHTVKGIADDAIPAFVRNHEMDLLVMGTVGRSGVPGFFIGNTAEKVLNTVDCSVLTLKPAGFKLAVK